MFMKAGCSLALLGDDPTISISLMSGKVICLRPSELAACELVARLLRIAITKRGQYRGFEIPTRPLRPKRRRRRSSSDRASVVTG
jgi:hypothetical protein